MDPEETKHHPADVAAQLERLPVEEAQQELRGLPHAEAAAVLAEMDEETRLVILDTLEAREIAEFLRALPHNEAADVLASVAPDRRPPVLELLPGGERERLAEILSYPPDSAGGIMSDQFIALDERMTIEEAQRKLRERSHQPPPNDLVAYLYVLDPSRRLSGIISIHDLVFRPSDRRIGDIMDRDVKHVWVDDDREEIAQLFDHYHYIALPVVDRAGRLAGIVQANQVIEVVRQEATEDMQLMVGLSGEERTLTPWRQSARRRLPWLGVNLGTAFLAASVVGYFEETIAAWTALAIFLPIVAGQGGNAGAQTLTVLIRDMAIGRLSRSDARQALRKESMLGIVNGLVIGSFVAVISYSWKGDPRLGMVVGLAMMLNLIAAALAGVLVPLTLRALRIDPALASSIILTSITDVTGFFFFLGLATAVSSWP